MKWLFFLLALFVTPALAQIGQPVQSYPLPRVVTNVSSTIVMTSTFQSLFSANANRLNCTVQNTGTNSMYVFFGAAADAATGTSVKLAAGQSLNCISGGVTYQGAVAITGTATETFYAVYQ